MRSHRDRGYICCVHLYSVYAEDSAWLRIIRKQIFAERTIEEMNPVLGAHFTKEETESQRDTVT